MKEILLFQIGDQRFGLDLRQIKQIQRGGGFFANPAEEKTSRALVSEGEEMTLCDLGAIFGAAPSALDPQRRKLLVVDMDGRSLALAVDQIEQIVAVQSDQIDALPPCFDGTSRACFPMVLRQGGESILVIDPGEVAGLRHLPLELAVKRALDPSRLENIVAQAAQEAVSNCFPEIVTDTLAKIKQRGLGKLRRVIRSGTGNCNDSPADINSDMGSAGNPSHARRD